MESFNRALAGRQTGQQAGLPDDYLMIPVQREGNRAALAPCAHPAKPPSDSSRRNITSMGRLTKSAGLIARGKPGSDLSRSIAFIA